MLTTIVWRHNVPGFGEWVQVVYPVELLGAESDPEVPVSQIADEHGARRLGSGAGFGNRDIDYGFSDRAHAGGFVKALRSKFRLANFHEEEG